MYLCRNYMLSTLGEALKSLALHMMHSQAVLGSACVVQRQTAPQEPHKHACGDNAQDLETVAHTMADAAPAAPDAAAAPMMADAPPAALDAAAAGDEAAASGSALPGSQATCDLFTVFCYHVQVCASPPQRLLTLTFDPAKESANFLPCGCVLVVGCYICRPSRAPGHARATLLCTAQRWR